MITGATPQINVKQLRKSLQSSPSPRLKTRRDGKSRYILVSTPVTLYNVQGNPNPVSNRPIQFNEDSTIDFGVYATGFRVVEVGENEVRLGSEHKILFQVVMQLAVIERGVYDRVMDFIADNDLDWKF